MTTKVTIKMDKPNHQDILVEQFDPTTGKPWHGAQRLTDGESTTLYVHGHMALRITEVAKVAPVVEVKPE